MPTGPQENKLPPSRLPPGPLAPGSGIPGPATTAKASGGKGSTSLEALMGNLPGLIYRCRNDKDWTAEFFSAGAQLITGYPAEDFNEHRRRFADLIHPDDRDAVWDQVQAAVGARQPFTLTYRIITADRSVRWVQEHGCGVFDPDNSLLALEGFITDITAQQKVEAKIREDEQQIRRLAAFAQLNPNPVLEFSADGTLSFTNPAAHAMARQIGVDDIAQLLPSEASAFVRTCLATGESRLRVLTHHGKHTISWSFYPITAEGHVHCYAGDISDRIALEEQLRQSQKMDAIGQLAGGVAHDFNNLLTVIHGNVSMAQLPDASEIERTDALSEIAAAAERAAGLTRQLLTFSRRQLMQTRPVDLNETVTAIARMLQRVLGEQVRIRLHLHSRPVMAMADPGMLDQVLMNLTVNARDAMPVGGLLTLATDLVMLSASDLVRFPESKPGPHVCLRVMDTGCGIAPEIISRIFEPFFTTKDPGKGTGLGLATVFGIVRQHGGSIGVSSELGHGTTFEILLPAADTGSAQPAPIKKIELPRGAGETVLVVEDAAAVRRFAARVLESHGYRVLEAGSGQEALLLFANSGARPDLLLTDMILPAGLTGRELADRLRAEVPAMRTLFMSGYPAGGSRPGLNLQEGINFLAKPFQADALLLCVRARLDSPV